MDPGWRSCHSGLSPYAFANLSQIHGFAADSCMRQARQTRRAMARILLRRFFGVVLDQLRRCSEHVIARTAHGRSGCSSRLGLATLRRKRQMSRFNRGESSGRASSASTECCIPRETMRFWSSNNCLMTQRSSVDSSGISPLDSSMFCMKTKKKISTGDGMSA